MVNARLELGARSRMAVDQAVEHAGACQFADGRGNRRSGGVGVGDIHASIVDELSVPNNWHTASAGPRGEHRSR
jgi:hypothetical protein